MYQLIRENLTGLGGPMGSERVTVDWSRYYHYLANAKVAAEKDHGKAISWVRQGTGFRSEDFGSHMYIINRLKLEDTCR